MKKKTLFAALLAIVFLTLPLAAQALNFEEIKFTSRQTGVNLQGSGPVELNQPIRAIVGNAGKLNKLMNNPAFAGANGDQVTVTFISENECEFLFPKQRMKAKLHFEGSGQELTALVDWLLEQKSQ